MKINMCGFIPKSFGTSLRMCDLPTGLFNQQSFDSDVRKVPGSWLKEPYPSIVFCGTDNRDFDNVKGTNRLFAGNDRGIDLSKTGQLQSIYGSCPLLFKKFCGPSHRVFVQTSHTALSVWQMNRVPKIPYQGGRFPIMGSQKEYAYLHTQAIRTATADQNCDNIRDITKDYSTIEVKTSAGYPYLEPFSPNIDFAFKIHIYRRASYYDIEIIGNHNEFPCYELFINDTSVYKYHTKWKGPNPINLNRDFSFTVKKRFLK